MNKKQWSVLAWSCLFMGMMFITLDVMKGGCLDEVFDLNFEEQTVYSPYDIWCIANTEMYEPFVFLFYSLWIIFLILGRLEK